MHLPNLDVSTGFYDLNYVMFHKKPSHPLPHRRRYRHPSALASRRQGKRRERHELAVGGKEGVGRRCALNYLRTHQPKPVNAGLGAPGLARHGAIHDRVHSGGEDHSSTVGAARKSRNTSVAVGVTILHLSMAGRGICPGPFIVFLVHQKLHITGRCIGSPTAPADRWR